MEDAQINRSFPFQVILPAECYSGSHFRQVHAFCIGLSLAPRGHVVMRGADWHYVFCFAKRQDAEQVRLRFGGQWYQDGEKAPPRVVKRA